MEESMAKTGLRSARTVVAKTTTLKDVARHCGVSPMTVSRILNNRNLAAKETADRVHQAARELKYTPNLVAKSLRLNKTLTFGLVASDGTHLLYSRLIHNVMEAATRAGYSMLIANTNRNPELESRSINMLLDKRIDGLILMAPYDVRRDELKKAHDLGVPVVVIMRDGDFPADYIVSDNAGAARELVNYLIGLGILDITFLNLPKNHPNGRERWRGYHRAMHEHGLPCGKDRMFHLTPGVWSGYEFMRNLIACGRRNGAFVCGCDSIAVGGIKAALDADIDVPGDMQFCGFDDIDMLDFLNVPLTTMRQRVEEMGSESIRMLLSRQDSEALGVDPIRLRLPCDLIVRRSTDPNAVNPTFFPGRPGLDYTRQ
jgi:DNA-binding LacI/PurR family transcriptional regulator